ITQCSEVFKLNPYITSQGTTHGDGPLYEFSQLFRSPSNPRVLSTSRGAIGQSVA
ncbi:hypothetical protein HAX54_000657, partial [Datura stramonium]|nr:hypothetical protein [Datura stramonium]